MKDYHGQVPAVGAIPAQITPANQVPRPQKPSERAGTPTHGALDRDPAAEILYRRGLVPADRVSAVLDALEACVVPDPRIQRIEALLDETDADPSLAGSMHEGMVTTYDIRSILGGAE